MTRALRGALFVSFVSTTMGASSAAHADDTTIRTHDASIVAAEALFHEGRALLDKGRFDEASERFARSQQLDPAVGTLLNLGECYERLDKTASAWAAYRQAVALAVTKNDERRATLARNAATRIEPQLTYLTIALAAPTPGLVVTRNGARIDAAAFNAPVPVDPGPQTIEANAPNRRPWSTTLKLAAGERDSVEIPELEPNVDVVDTPPPPAVEDPPRAPLQRKVALGLEIGGGAVVVTGLVLGGLALSRWASVTSTCPNGVCKTEAERQERLADVDAAQTLATLSTVATSVGAATMAIGVVLHLTAPKHNVAVTPLVNRGGAGLMATFEL